MKRSTGMAVEEQQSHNRLQSLCYRFHVKEFPEDRHLLHPNINNSVGGVRGSQNMALGVTPGRADAEFFYQGKFYLFEFKVDADYQKPDQVLFQQAVEANGAKYFIIRSIEQYENIIYQIKAGTVEPLTESEMKEYCRTIEDNSVVRLKDGALGVWNRRLHTVFTNFETMDGPKFSLFEKLEVVKTATQLAIDYINQNK